MDIPNAAHSSVEFESIRDYGRHNHFEFGIHLVFCVCVTAVNCFVGIEILCVAHKTPILNGSPVDRFDL